LQKRSSLTTIDLTEDDTCAPPKKRQRKDRIVYVGSAKGQQVAPYDDWQLVAPDPGYKVTPGGSLSIKVEEGGHLADTIVVTVPKLIISNRWQCVLSSVRKKHCVLVYKYTRATKSASLWLVNYGIKDGEQACESCSICTAREAKKEILYVRLDWLNPVCLTVPKSGVHFNRADSKTLVASVGDKKFILPRMFCPTIPPDSSKVNFAAFVPRDNRGRVDELYFSLEFPTRESATEFCETVDRMLSV